MPWSLQGGRHVLALASARIVSPTAPSRWLIGLRWGAILGMLVTALVARNFVPALDTRPVLVALGALAVVNVAWTVVASFICTEQPGLVTAQLSQDVIALGGILWLSGGVSNPFACFLSFQIVLAGLLGTPRAMLLITALTVACVAVLTGAPPLSMAGAPEGELRTTLLAQVVSLAALAVFTGFFVFVYARRLETFRDAVTRNEKLAALGRTLGAIAHELNTPLGTILLAGRELELLGKGEDAVKLAGTVVEEARRASDIIALLRGYVRPDAQREELDVATFVPAWADKELNRLGFTGERVVRVSGPCPVSVIRVALCQVLTNVISNAVDAMHNAAKPRLELEVTDRVSFVEISVRDTGGGISPQLIARLGEPFQTTKEERGGTGLGLYVSGLLAERMGATLQLESRPGEGTRVSLSLQRGGGTG